ncbi:MAG: hypothetical protein L6461_06465 [Anaerolineae bacterium]|nr:hypothetical protein [Anaerolineae bacterium]
MLFAVQSSLLELSSSEHLIAHPKSSILEPTPDAQGGCKKLFTPRNNVTCTRAQLDFLFLALKHEILLCKHFPHHLPKKLPGIGDG